MKEDGGDYWRKVYIVPWCRVGCWAVGMLLGLLVYRRGKKMLRNKVVIMGSTCSINKNISLKLKFYLIAATVVIRR